MLRSLAALRLRLATSVGLVVLSVEFVRRLVRRSLALPPPPLLLLSPCVLAAVGTESHGTRRDEEERRRTHHSRRRAPAKARDEQTGTTERRDKEAQPKRQLTLVTSMGDLEAARSIDHGHSTPLPFVSQPPDVLASLVASFESNPTNLLSAQRTPHTSPGASC